MIGSSLSGSRFPVCALAVFLMLAPAAPADAAARDYAIEVSAVVQEAPPRIDFTWPVDVAGRPTTVYRKLPADSTWGEPIAVLDSLATSFRDSDVALGEAYEYAFRRTLSVIEDSLLVATGQELTFTIRDSWGDGMCCHHGLGSFEIRSGDSLLATGGQFGSVQVRTFVAPDTGGPTAPLAISLIVDAFPQETTWTLTDTAGGDTLAAGGPYESPVYAHVLAGIGYSEREDRGTVLLVLTAGVASHAADEVDRLELDLIADGYRVQRHVVLPGDGVPDVKSAILAACASDPTIETLFLLGHVPVPYSGNVQGAHLDHQGAWPADLYYGELDGEWTDSIVNNTSASRPANHNVPGDGKFDQTFLPSDVDLQVGRVDVSAMQVFPDDEFALIRDYLDKNHAYRRGAFTPERRGLIDDNVGDAYGLAFAAVGWRNFTAMFGPGNVHTADYFGTLASQSYLWAYGCGGGSYISCAGVGTTADFAANSPQVVFSPLYGSYFGDWDNTNNLLRAPLASAGQPLACFWSGRPTWHLHHMALGHPIGISTRLTQNNNHTYTVSDGTRQIHTALMGDPTLTLHVVEPVTSLTLAEEPPGSVRLTWAPAGGGVDGYHVYRAIALHETFERIHAEAITDTCFVDAAPAPGNNVYMVRARKLETAASGTYFNLGAGLIDSIAVETGAVEAAPTSLGCFLRCFPNPLGGETTVRYHLPGAGEIDLAIYTVSGRRIRTLAAETRPVGWHGTIWDGRNSEGREVAAGTYFCRLRAAGETRTQKIIRIR